MRVGVFVIGLFSILGGRALNACQCLERPLLERIKSTPYVFVAVKSSLQFTGERSIETVMMITETYKGGLMAGAQIALDTFSGTSCPVFVLDGVQVLILASGEAPDDLHASRCSVFAVEPIWLQGSLYEPSEEIQKAINFLRKANNSEAKD